MKTVSEVLASGVAQMKTIVGRPERGSRVYETSLTPLACDDGGVLGVLVIARDVTHLVRGTDT
jgi:hypothetical protein